MHPLKLSSGEAVYLDSFMTATRNNDYFDKGARSKRRCSPDIAKFRSSMKPLGPVNESSRSIFFPPASTEIKQNVKQKPAAAKVKSRPVRRSTRLYRKMTVNDVSIPIHVKKLEDPVKRLLSTPDFQMHSDIRSQEIFLACLGLRSTKPLSALTGVEDSRRRIEVDEQNAAEGSGAFGVTSSGNYEAARLHGSISGQSDEELEIIASTLQPWALRDLSFGESPGSLPSHLIHRNMGWRRRAESNRRDISFEELLADGYMIYPHDLLLPVESVSISIC